MYLGDQFGIDYEPNTHFSHRSVTLTLALEQFANMIILIKAVF